MRISIEGNIGSGKTFYLDKLKKDNYAIIHDLIDSQTQISTWLKKYDSNPDRYSFGLQMQILQDYIKLPYVKNNINIYESSPYTLKNVYGKILYDEKHLDKDEYLLHNSYINDFGWMPDIIIYLYCDPEICYERVKNKSRVSCDYFKKLHLINERTFDDLNCSIPIYKVNSQEDTNNVYKNIKTICDEIAKTSKFPISINSS